MLSLYQEEPTDDNKILAAIIVLAHMAINSLGPYFCLISKFQLPKKTVVAKFNSIIFSESIPALGWVTVSPAPAPFVLEMFNAGQFYTNR